MSSTISHTYQVVSFPSPLETHVGSLALQGFQTGDLCPHLQGLLWSQAFD